MICLWCDVCLVHAVYSHPSTQLAFLLMYLSTHIPTSFSYFSSPGVSAGPAQVHSGVRGRAPRLMQGSGKRQSLRARVSSQPLRTRDETTGRIAQFVVAVRKIGRPLLSQALDFTASLKFLTALGHQGDGRTRSSWVHVECDGLAHFRDARRW